jgi:uncharacterized protein (DUF2147 family)
MRTADVTPPAVPVEPKLAKAPPESPAKQADTPLGDWRTEGGKGLVRIETCGSALCGYVLDPSSHAIGESVLVNMKPNGTALWSGNVYSRATGTTYYGTMRMKGADSLRVEACALGRFFCSGNVWSRVGRPHEYISSSQAVPEPRS